MGHLFFMILAVYPGRGVFHPVPYVAVLFFSPVESVFWEMSLSSQIEKRQTDSTIAPPKTSNFHQRRFQGLLA